MSPLVGTTLLAPPNRWSSRPWPNCHRRSSAEARKVPVLFEEECYDDPEILGHYGYFEAGESPTPTARSSSI